MIKIYKTIQDLNEDSWNEFTKNKGLYYSREWLISNENAFSDEIYYLIHYHKNKIKGFAFLSIIRKKIEWDYYNVHEIFQNYSLDDHNYILVGVPFGYNSGFLFDDEDSFNLLNNQIENLKVDLKLSYITIVHCDNKEKKLFQNKGYTSNLSCQDTVIDLKELNNNYELYLKRITLRRYIKETKHLNNSDFTIRKIIDFKHIIQQLATLEGNLLIKYGFSKTLDLNYSKKWFDNINKLYKENSFIYALYYNNEIIGFSLFIINGNVGYFKTCGFDYEKTPKNIYSYFNLAFYTPIKDLINLNAIYYGVGTLVAKTQRGANLISKYLLVKK